MNLILAIVWFLLGTGIFVYPYCTGEPSWRILGNPKDPQSGFSAGWLMYALCLYNLIRWYSTRTSRQEQRQMRLTQALRERHPVREPIGDPDPNFDFTSTPPPPQNPNITEQPPSNN